MLKHLRLSHVAPGVLQVELYRPKVLHAFNDAMFQDITTCFQHMVPTLQDVRAIVLCADTESPHFSAGLDLRDPTLHEILQGSSGPSSSDSNPDQGKHVDDVGRRQIRLHALIQRWQAAFNSIEQCGRPVIAAIHGGCIGAGIDLITACDVRWCSSDAFFAVKEVDIGIAADLGTLQRLQHTIGHASAIRDWCFRGRKVPAKEALQVGLVSEVVSQNVRQEAISWAKEVAEKSPVALWSIKRVLNHARDHGVSSGLDYVAAWNAGALQTVDVKESMNATLMKRKPRFSKL